MPDKHPDPLTPTPPEPKGPDPIAPGDFVTIKGGHPQKGDLKAEPVGRVVAIEPLVKVVVDKDGKPALDKDGAVRTEPDGERLVVTWPKLRVETRHAAEELERRKP